MYGPLVFLNTLFYNILFLKLIKLFFLIELVNFIDNFLLLMLSGATYLLVLLQPLYIKPFPFTQG